VINRNGMAVPTLPIPAMISQLFQSLKGGHFCRVRATTISSTIAPAVIRIGMMNCGGNPSDGSSWLTASRVKA